MRYRSVRRFSKSARREFKGQGWFSDAFRGIPFIGNSVANGMDRIYNKIHPGVNDTLGDHTRLGKIGARAAYHAKNVAKVAAAAAAAYAAYKAAKRVSSGPASRPVGEQLQTPTPEAAAYDVFRPNKPVFNPKDYMIPPSQPGELPRQPAEIPRPPRGKRELDFPNMDSKRIRRDAHDQVWYGDRHPNDTSAHVGTSYHISQDGTVSSQPSFPNQRDFPSSSTDYDLGKAKIPESMGKMFGRTKKIPESMGTMSSAATSTSGSGTTKLPNGGFLIDDSGPSHRKSLDDVVEEVDPYLRQYKPISTFAALLGQPELSLLAGTAGYGLSNKNWIKYHKTTKTQPMYTADYDPTDRKIQSDGITFRLRGTPEQQQAQQEEIESTKPDQPEATGSGAQDWGWTPRHDLLKSGPIKVMPGYPEAAGTGMLDDWGSRRDLIRTAIDSKHPLAYVSDKLVGSGMTPNQPQSVASDIGIPPVGAHTTNWQENLGRQMPGIIDGFNHGNSGDTAYHQAVGGLTNPGSFLPSLPSNPISLPMPSFGFGTKKKGQIKGDQKSFGKGVKPTRAPSKWMEHVKSFHKANKHLTYKQAMQQAKHSYQK